MTHKDIDHLSWQYRKQGLLIVGCLFLVALLVMNVLLNNLFITPLIVCALYGMVFEIVEGIVWAKVAKKSADNLPNFFMAVSGVRFFSALALMLVYYLVANRMEMLHFLLIFAVFYMATVVHHVAFFRKHTDIQTDK